MRWDYWRTKQGELRWLFKSTMQWYDSHIFPALYAFTSSPQLNQPSSQPSEGKGQTCQLIAVLGMLEVLKVL